MSILCRVTSPGLMPPSGRTRSLESQQMTKKNKVSLLSKPQNTVLEPALPLNVALKYKSTDCQDLLSLIFRNTWIILVLVRQFFLLFHEYHSCQKLSHTRVIFLVFKDFLWMIDARLWWKYIRTLKPFISWQNRTILFLRI